MSNKVEINILSKIIHINCPVEKQATLKQASLNFEQTVLNLRAKFSTIPLDTALVISGINLSNQLQNKEQEITELQNKITDLYNIIANKIPSNNN